MITEAESVISPDAVCVRSRGGATSAFVLAGSGIANDTVSSVLSKNQATPTSITRSTSVSDKKVKITLGTSTILDPSSSPLEQDGIMGNSTEVLQGIVTKEEETRIPVARLMGIADGVPQTVTEG